MTAKELCPKESGGGGGSGGKGGGQHFSTGLAVAIVFIAMYVKMCHTIRGDSVKTNEENPCIGARILDILIRSRHKAIKQQ